MVDGFCGLERERGIGSEPSRHGVGVGDEHDATEGGVDADGVSPRLRRWEDNADSPAYPALDGFSPDGELFEIGG